MKRVIGLFGVVFATVAAAATNSGFLDADIQRSIEIAECRYRLALGVKSSEERSIKNRLRELLPPQDAREYVDWKHLVADEAALIDFLLVAPPWQVGSVFQFREVGALGDPRVIARFDEFAQHASYRALRAGWMLRKGAALAIGGDVDRSWGAVQKAAEVLPPGAVLANLHSRIVGLGDGGEPPSEKKQLEFLRSLTGPPESRPNDLACPEAWGEFCPLCRDRDLRLRIAASPFLGPDFPPTGKLEEWKEMREQAKQLLPQETDQLLIDFGIAHKEVNRARKSPIGPDEELVARLQSLAATLQDDHEAQAVEVLAMEALLEAGKFEELLVIWKRTMQRPGPLGAGMGHFMSGASFSHPTVVLPMAKQLQARARTNADPLPCWALAILNHQEEDSTALTKIRTDLVFGRCDRVIDYSGVNGERKRSVTAFQALNDAESAFTVQAFYHYRHWCGTGAGQARRCALEKLARLQIDAGLDLNGRASALLARFSGKEPSCR